MPAQRAGGLQRGALAGIIAILVHNVAEFDMQIPGTAILFWIAVGILFSSPAGNHAGAAWRSSRDT